MYWLGTMSWQMPFHVTVYPFICTGPTGGRAESRERWYLRRCSQYLWTPSQTGPQWIGADYSRPIFSGSSTVDSAGVSIGKQSFSEVLFVVWHSSIPSYGTLARCLTISRRPYGWHRQELPLSSALHANISVSVTLMQCRCRN